MSAADSRLIATVKALAPFVLGLGIWVNRETQRVMDGDTDSGALIEINQIIMDGLK